MTTEDKANLPPAQRIEAVLSFAFRGIHHVYGIHKISDSFWKVNHSGSVSTTDFDQLTRLVYAAHKYAVRVEIKCSGPGMIKLLLHARNRDLSNWSESHPTLETVISKYDGLNLPDQR